MNNIFKNIMLPLGMSLSLLSEAAGGPFAPDAESFFLYVGAYTDSDEEGIYVYHFDASEGDLKYLYTMKGVKNPSYLAISPKKNLLLAVNEIGDYEGQKSGAVTSFRIDPASGKLTKLNQVATGGGAPCYVSINKATDLAFVANYSGGNVATFSIGMDGRLKAYSDLQQHSGSGTVEGRQDHPHAHAIVLDPKENYALAVDLGINKVITYAINGGKGVLKAGGEFLLADGAGPRHLTFHPNKKFAFVINGR